MPAHPRSRGENIRSAYLTEATAGSSPLTRGKHLAFTLPNRHVRLIPAHAGKTKMTDALTAAPPAHPRSRGENGKNVLAYI